jgi:hypothetical protein
MVVTVLPGIMPLSRANGDTLPKVGNTLLGGFCGRPAR